MNCRPKCFARSLPSAGSASSWSITAALPNAAASRWVTQPEHLSGLMERIDCRMGHTQIGKVLAHARRESELLKVQALVFVGDAMEENPDDLARDAAALGKAGVPAFMFQEGTDREVELYFGTSLS